MGWHGCHEIDGWGSPGGVGSDRGLYLCALLLGLFSRSLIQVETTEEPRETACFQTMECKPLTKICVSPLHPCRFPGDEFCLRILSDGDLFHFVTLLMVYSFVSHFLMALTKC